MKKKIKFVLSLLLFLVLSFPNLAQGPGEPYHPMTANGARHINFTHKLFWENPTNTTYNDIYISQDSNLVITLDSTALILSGHDSSQVFNEFSIELLGTFGNHTKYYWRVVENNSFGTTAGPVWHFITESGFSYWIDYFDGPELSDYIIQPPGAYWFISNSSFAGGTDPELTYVDLYSIGTSYLILDDYFDLSPDINPLSFKYGVLFMVGEFIIGFAYSLDEGTTWIPFWQQVVTENIPPTQIYSAPIPNENYVKLALFCTSINPYPAGWWYVDNLILDSPLTVPTPPSQIQALADTSALRVLLNWSPGWGVGPIAGYKIQRKIGLPTSSSAYQTIAEVGPYELSLEDSMVQLNTIYTYRIQTKLGWGGVTTWSNEATAYVPSIVPVELQGFTAEVSGSNVKLIWLTSTETNNSGFEILRFTQNDNNGWEKIGFVSGFGTTTELHYYYYVDESLQPGNYQYRLKQIDFDGSFEYSNIIEVTVNAPTEFSLEQNFPNPFNPSTKIKYEIPGQARNDNTLVTLKVYDVLGNEIATIVNEQKPAGNYEVEFDASTIPGFISAKGGYASGVYFYQLKAGKFIQTKKMILLR